MARDFDDSDKDGGERKSRNNDKPMKTERPWLIRNLETGNDYLATSKDTVDPQTGKVSKVFGILGRRPKNDN